MGADIEVKVTDNSAELAKSINNRVPVILDACGLEAEKFAKKGARVDTGRYRASITHTVSGQGGKVHEYKDNDGQSFTEDIRAVPENESAMYVGTNVDYAMYLEHLDHTIKNSIADHISEYKKIIKEGLKIK